MTRPKIGIFADCTDVSMPILDLAVEAVRRGFEGLFLNEHTHLPKVNDGPAGHVLPWLDRLADPLARIRQEP